MTVVELLIFLLDASTVTATSIETASPGTTKSSIAEETLCLPLAESREMADDWRTVLLFGTALAHTDHLSQKWLALQEQTQGNEPCRIASAYLDLVWRGE